MTAGGVSAASRIGGAGFSATGAPAVRGGTGSGANRSEGAIVRGSGAGGPRCAGPDFCSSLSATAVVVAGAGGGIAECSKTSGFRAATSTVAGSDTTTCAPPSWVASSRRWLPVARGGGKTTNWPELSASTFAITRPPSRNSTAAFGAACPATTVSPVGSTRTTSNAGRSIVSSVAGAGAADIFGSEFVFGPSGSGSILSLELEVVCGDVKTGNVSVGPAAVDGSGRAGGDACGPGFEFWIGAGRPDRRGLRARPVSGDVSHENRSSNRCRRRANGHRQIRSFHPIYYAELSPLTQNARLEATSRFRENASLRGYVPLTR